MMKIMLEEDAMHNCKDKKNYISNITGNTLSEI